MFGEVGTPSAAEGRQGSVSPGPREVRKGTSRPAGPCGSASPGQRVWLPFTLPVPVLVPTHLPAALPHVPCLPPVAASSLPLSPRDKLLLAPSVSFLWTLKSILLRWETVVYFSLPSWRDIPVLLEADSRKMEGNVLQDHV